MTAGPKAICDRCALTVRHFDCKVEWTGLFVCQDCFDPRPVWLDSPYVSPTEAMPLPNARIDRDAGEDNGTFLDDDFPITQDDL